MPNFCGIEIVSDRNRIEPLMFNKKKKRIEELELKVQDLKDKLAEREEEAKKWHGKYFLLAKILRQALDES